MREYQDRNETTKYRYQTPIIQYGDTDTVTVELVVKVPKR